jgi:transcriptional regulator with XRE-family HTH domain
MATAGQRTIAEQIRRARLARGLTQAQLADQAGLTQSQLSRIESELHPTTRDVLRRIATALDVQLVVSPEGEG